MSTISLLPSGNAASVATRARTMISMSPAGRLALLFLLGPGFAWADTFCAESGAELQAALTAAQSNGESDTIRVKTGTHARPGGSIAFSYATDESFALTIEGGYGAGCGRKFDRARLTVLSGGGTQQVMKLYSDANETGAIKVSNLSIRDGESAGEGAGLSIGGPTNVLFPPFLGAVTVERVIFAFNDSDVRAGGLSIHTRGNIIVRGNAFMFNRCAEDYCALAVTGQGIAADRVQVYFGGNTIAANTCALGAPSCDSGGAGFFLFQNLVVYDNVFGFNTGVDLSMQTPGVAADLYYNNITTMQGQPASEVGTLAVANPLFVDVLGEDFHLQPGSPMRNEGYAPFALPAIDLDGRQRIVESAPDLGAYEFQEFLFEDGFEFVE